MDIHNFLSKIAFNRAVRLRLWKKLAAQTRHGMSLDLALQQMRNRAQERHSLTTAIYETILERLGHGHDLGTSLFGFATPEEIMLISSGQRSGKIHDGLILASNLNAARGKIVKDIVSALAYPTFLIGMCILLLLVVSFVVMPKFAILSNPATWNGSAKTFYNLTSFISSSSGIIFLTIVILVIITSILTFSVWTGKVRIYFEHIPPWSIYKMLVGSVWLLTVSTLMKSGLQLNHILDNMIQSENTTLYLKERVFAISLELGMGKNLGESLYDAAMQFPDRDVIDDLIVYATLPNFYLRIYEIAEEWMESGIEIVKQQTRIINIFCILFIAGFISFIAVSISSIQSQLLPGGF